MLMKFENALQQEMGTKSTYVSRLKKTTKENILHNVSSLQKRAY